MSKEIKFAFFGTTEFSVIVLDELKAAGLVPSLIVTVPDKPKGRKLLLTPPPVKLWAKENGIETLQPKKLDKDFNPRGKTYGVTSVKFDVFIVFSYGKIIPQAIVDMPKHGTINLHPSLLPKLRGPSPIKSAILVENETGVTIIKLDAEMDHGPILIQKKVTSWESFNPPYEVDLETKLAHEGGKMLAEIMPDWINEKIKVIGQDESLATFCKKIEKEDGKINLDDNPELNLRKIRAFHVWPTAYFFDKDGKRVIIKKAHIDDGKLVIDRVVPEGKKERDYRLDEIF